MKKKVTYSIFIALILIIVAIIGSTYAYYSLVAAGSNKNVSTNSEKYEVIYNGGTDIDSTNCQMNVVARKEDGCSTVVEIGVSEDVNVKINANLYINIDLISDKLKTEGFKWEVYELNGTNETLVSNGNFKNIPNNNQIQIVSNRLLTYPPKKYKIYFWIDGNLTNNTIANSSFRGYIGANTEMLTGIVNNS